MTGGGGLGSQPVQGGEALGEFWNLSAPQGKDLEAVLHEVGGGLLGGGGGGGSSWSHLTHAGCPAWPAGAGLEGRQAGRTIRPGCRLWAGRSAPRVKAMHSPRLQGPAGQHTRPLCRAEHWWHSGSRGLAALAHSGPEHWLSGIEPPIPAMKKSWHLLAVPRGPGLAWPRQPALCPAGSLLWASWAKDLGVLWWQAAQVAPTHCLQAEPPKNSWSRGAEGGGVR